LPKHFEMKDDHQTSIILPLLGRICPQIHEGPYCSRAIKDELG